MLALLKITHIKILKSASFWVSIIFVIFFLSFVPAAMVIPSSGFNFVKDNILLKTQISASIIITGLLLVVVISFAESYVKIKTSLLYKNVLLSDKPKYQFYVSTIIPIITFATLTFAISLSYLAILDSVGLIAGASLDNQKNIIDWNNVNYLIFFVAIILTVLLGLSVVLLLSSFVNNINVFTSLTWAYLFLIFFFGGASVPLFILRGDNAVEAFKYISYAIPSVWTNFLFIDAFSGQNIDWYEIVIPLIISLVFLSIRFLVVLRKG